MAEDRQFTHFDQGGNAHMVDVSAKETTARQAVAVGMISLSPQAYVMVREQRASKGDVLGVARIAGIMAAKRVHEFIPLCHPLGITSADIAFSFDDAAHAISIEASITTTGRTGVEMEALTAVSITALTIYDMCKAVDKNMIISAIQLVHKSGGASGLFMRSSTLRSEMGGKP